MIFGLLIYSNILTWVVVFDLSKPHFLEVTFFDVGQGDAIFIETPQRHQILIDGGPDQGILEKLGEEMPFWDKTIDLVILTHPEHDHIAGLIEVLKRYKVENILWTGVVRDTSEYKQWQYLIKEEEKQGAQITIAEAAQKVIWLSASPGSHPGKQKWLSGYLEILHPFESLEGQKPKNTNNSSVIGRLVFGKNSFLFTGDAYKSVERKLVKKGTKLLSDVLKVGHHGSKTSSSQEFIAEVLPQIAVISVGKNNRYGHPHSDTLKILHKYGIKILRTDKDGDIKIFSDGNNFKFKTQNSKVKATTQN